MSDCYLYFPNPYSLISNHYMRHRIFGAVRTKSVMNNGTELFHGGFALLSLKFRFVCYGVKIMRITVPRV